MKLIVRAKHFKGTQFVFGGKCALEKAAIEQFDEMEVAELVNSIFIGEIEYLHRSYVNNEFNKDKIKAKELKYSDEIVRRIILKPA